MNNFTVNGVSSPTFGQHTKIKKHSKETRVSPYEQPQDSALSRRASRGSEESLTLTPQEKAFRKRLEQNLFYIYNNADPGLVPHKPKAEKWFLKFYKEVYPQKLAQWRQLQEQLDQKGLALEAAREREKMLGPVAKWPGWSGAVVGLGVESAIHLSTLGTSMFVLPPGSVTALGAAVGKWAGNAGSPEKVERDISDIQSDLEDLRVYLGNLKAQKRAVDDRQSRRAALSSDHFQRRSSRHQGSSSRNVGDPESSSRRRSFREPGR
jgi:hypothetical protein